MMTHFLQSNPLEMSLRINMSRIVAPDAHRHRAGAGIISVARGCDATERFTSRLEWDQASPDITRRRLVSKELSPGGPGKNKHRSSSDPLGGGKAAFVSTYIQAGGREQSRPPI